MSQNSLVQDTQVLSQSLQFYLNHETHSNNKNKEQINHMVHTISAFLHEIKNFNSNHKKLTPD